jgi:F-box/leucine-rich repeat protein 2/20
MALILDFQDKPSEFVNSEEIEALSLRGCCEWVTDDVLEQVSVSGRIHTAAFFRCWRLSDKGMTSFLKRNGARLRRLELSGCMHLTDITLRSINRFCTNLEELDLTRCLRISDVGINYIISNQLQILLLYADSQLTCSAYEAIASCYNLRKLDLCGHSNLDTIHSVKILKACGEQIQYLNLTWCVNVTDELITFIVRNKSLRNIKYLSLFGIKNLTSIETLITYLGGIESLTHLDIRGIPAAHEFTQNDCTQLRSRIPQLVEWKLHH